MKLRGAALLESRVGWRFPSDVLLWADAPDMRIDDPTRFAGCEEVSADLVIPKNGMADNLDFDCLRGLHVTLIADRYTDRIEELCQAMTFSCPQTLTAAILEQGDLIEYVRGGIRV